MTRIPSLGSTWWKEKRTEYSIIIVLIKNVQESDISVKPSRKQSETSTLHASPLEKGATYLLWALYSPLVCSSFSVLFQRILWSIPASLMWTLPSKLRPSYIGCHKTTLQTNVHHSHFYINRKERFYLWHSKIIYNKNNFQERKKFIIFSTLAFGKFREITLDL